MSRPLRLSALLILLALGSAAGQSDNAKLQSITYADLGKLVRSHKGKPIVVYVWHES
jgi:hypothetical protein